MTGIPTRTESFIIFWFILVPFQRLIEAAWINSGLPF